MHGRTASSLTLQQVRYAVNLFRADRPKLIGRRSSKVSRPPEVPLLEELHAWADYAARALEHRAVSVSQLVLPHVELMF